MQCEWQGEEKGSQVLLVWDTTGSRVSLLDGSSGEDWWPVCPFSPGLLLPTSDFFRDQTEDFGFFQLSEGGSHMQNLYSDLKDEQSGCTGDVAERICL